MSYKDFYNDIKSNQLSSLYLLYGSEKLMIDRMLEQLINSALEPSMCSFNYIAKSAEDLSFAEAMSAVERLPLMDARIIVVISDADLLMSSQWTDDERKNFIDYHKDNSTLTTVLVAAHVDKRKQFYKHVKKVGKAIAFERLDQRTLAKWIMQEAGRMGKAIDMNTALRLGDKLGYGNKDATIDLYGVLSTLQRICDLTKRATIDAENLDEVVDNSLEANIFKMIDALFEGRAKQAFQQFKRLLASGEVAIKINFMIHRHLRQLQKINYLAAQNYSAKSIESALGLKHFVVRKALGQLKRYSADDLKRLLEVAIDCDLQVKSSLDGIAAVQNLMGAILLCSQSI